MSKKRVIVVDDSAFMRSTISRLIEKDARMEVIDTARDGVEAIEKVCSLKPDIVTMDIEMPNKNGLEALAEIMERCPTRVVMVSSLTEAGAQETLRALELGAVDFFPKSMQDSDKSIFAKSDILRDKIYNASLIESLDTLKNPEPAHEAQSEVKVTPQSGSQLRFRRGQIIVIGISTGGPKALHAIMPLLPATLRAPVLIVQHMPPNFTGAMARRLDSISPLSVSEAEDGVTLEPGHVYIAPGGMQTTVVKKDIALKFVVKADNENSIYKPSVELATESIHNAVGGNVLAVMMTGMGSDGLKGFTKLKAAGAYVIAQDQETCVVYGMPKAVVEKGLANEVLPLAAIPQTIERLLG